MGKTTAPMLSMHDVTLPSIKAPLLRVERFVKGWCFCCIQVRSAISWVMVNVGGASLIVRQRSRVMIPFWDGL